MVKKRESIKRTYVGYLPFHTSVEKTVNLFNKGSRFLMEEWLKLMGGFHVDFLPKHMQKKSSEHAFAFWFTPVSGNRNPELVVPADKLKERFVSYWGSEEGISEAVDHIFQTCDTNLNKKNVVVWVDRRMQFVTSGLRSSDVAALFSDPYFPLWNSKEEEEAVEEEKKKGKKKGKKKKKKSRKDDDSSNAYFRNLISRYWGEGKKADYSESVVFLREFKNQLRLETRLCDILPMPDYDEQYKLWHESGAKEGSHPAIKLLRSKLGAKPGRASSLMLAFAKHYTDLINSDILATLMKAILSEQEKSDYRDEFKEMPCFASLKDRLLQHLGMRELKVDNFCDMFAMFMPSYRSWRSNFLRQANERVDRYKEYVKYTQMPLNEEVAIIVAESKKSNNGQADQKFLSTRQFRGIKELLKWWKTGNADYMKPVREKGYKFGDSDLLSKLGAVLHNDKNAKDVINQVINTDVAGDSYVNFLNPYINLNRSQHFRPCKAKILFDEKAGRDNARFIEMEVFDGEKMVTQKVVLADKRLFKEVVPGKDNEGRNSRLMMKVYGRNITVNPDPISLQFFRRNEDKNRWSCAVAVTLPERKPIKEYVQQFLNEEGVSSLSVDLGQRDPVAFMHFKTKRDGEIEIVSQRNSNDKLNLTLVECGFLEDSHLTRSNKRVSRLSGRDVSINDSDRAIWKEMTSLVEWKGDIPNSRVAFAKSLSFCVQRIAKTLPLDQAVECVNKVKNHLSGHFRRDEDGDRQGFGYLTFDRLFFLANIRSAYQSLQGRYEDETKSRVGWIDEQIRKMYKRIVNIRKERSRIIVNLILKKAMEIGASLISVEDITLRVNQNQTSNRNKKLVDWCCVKVKDDLIEAGREVGIIVKDVQAAYSSMVDFFAHDYRPRFNRYLADSPSLDDAIEKLEDWLKTATGDRATIAALWCNAKVKNGGTLKENILADAEDKKYVFIPRSDGKYYPSSVYGWTDADVHAAGVIGMRGIILLLGWYREKKEEENTTTTEKKLEKVVYSRDVNDVPDLTWAMGENDLPLLDLKTWTPS